MGGEGANWIGEAPPPSGRTFSRSGDGTYNHSGYMAIHGAIASGVNITYKILFNDAVAMTGGKHDGGLTRRLPVRWRRGAKRVVVVTDGRWRNKHEDWRAG
jgi:indolepyruvate ferredoxin oxidoreductase